MKNVLTWMTAALLLALCGNVPAQSSGAPTPAKKRAAEKAAERAAEKADAPVKANGGVFRCTDRDGNTTYSNVGDVKGCKPVETDALNTVPFPKASAAAPKAGAAGTPPKADAAALRSRDTDRRRILQEELASEEKKLAELRKEYNNGEPERKGDEKNYQKYLDRTDKLKADVTRSESNIESLKRELANLKD